MSQNKRFELSIVGDTPIWWRRWHATYGAAVTEAKRVHARMDESGYPETEYQRAAHPAIIYGPGLDRDGVTLT